ncbi:hypothetical protein OAV15_04255, partial [Amylibacter sp.]|nr:hypothetical protein [Amylibacter sp.]
GEDISDPYGGAFKVTKGISKKFTNNVISTPISESAITGFGLGLSFFGKEIFVEIMFGDFMPHTFDQLLSNASKFYHMTGFKQSTKLRIRTPMGGGRGYGPTHSQSLEKHFVGIDNILVIAITSLIDPSDDLKKLSLVDCSAIIIENKIGYTRYLWQPNKYYEVERMNSDFGFVRIRPKYNVPNAIIISYGECARLVADNLVEIFKATDTVVELVCLIKLHPFDPQSLEKVSKNAKMILTIEDGSTSYGIGSEIISSIKQKVNHPIQFAKLGAKPLPIPSEEGLEKTVLPSLEDIITSLNGLKERI